MKYDELEKDLIQEFENEEWKSVEDIDKMKAEMKSAVRVTITKNKRINIRLSEKDVALLKVRAIEEGLPYQTLISSILHKYIYGS
ncbi:MAG: antitoxin [Ignavibacteriales bacterium]|nr:antitoxin [Ignavibacteriales bacterium]